MMPTSENTRSLIMNSSNTCIRKVLEILPADEQRANAIIVGERMARRQPDQLIAPARKE
jgi:hypothetical protein